MPGSKIAILLLAMLFAGCTDSRHTSEPNKLVSTEWLQDNLNDTALIVIHVGRKVTFDSIHIPHSQYLSPREFLTTTDSLRNEMPDIHIIDSVLTSIGIKDHSRIILCYEDDYLIPVTTRLFLTLDYAGLEKRSFVLNGGLTQWISEGRITTDSIFPKAPGNLTLMRNDKILISANELKELLKNPENILVDARAVEYYTGKFDSALNRYLGGHIEGAVNLPFEYLLADTPRYIFRDTEELRKEFENIGMDDNKTIILSCNTGILATVNYLAAVECGYRALFYDGSFEEWERLHLPVIKPVPPRQEN